MQRLFFCFFFPFFSISHAICQQEQAFSFSKVEHNAQTSIMVQKSVTPFIPTCQQQATIGIMCKVEKKLEKLTQVPIRLRLGTLEYTNILEGKYSHSQVLPIHE